MGGWADRKYETTSTKYNSINDKNISVIKTNVNDQTQTNRQR